METAIEVGNVQQIPVGKHTLYYGDCRDGLRRISDNSIHLIVTSPPYNIGIGYGKWTDYLPLEDYQVFTEAWLTECYRILSDGGKLCVNLPFTDHQHIAFLHFNMMRALGLKFINTIIWIKWDEQRKDKFAVSQWRLKRCRFPLTTLINAYEIILVMQKHHNHSPCKTDLTDDEFEQWKYNVWFIPPLTDRTHPAPFPSELPKRLIKLYSSPHQVVLDPFLGSGTTMKVADELNRTCIGCEMDESYVKMTVERMKNDKMM
jgi:site-specific DNA-methyltransferase (adenine-specific)